MLSFYIYKSGKKSQSVAQLPDLRPRCCAGNAHRQQFRLQERSKGRHVFAEGIRSASFERPAKT